MGMKWKKVAITTAVMSATMAMTAFAGEWKTADNGNWWYDNGNGSYTSNGWQWIDGNGDGVAESYYFDGNGYLLTNTTTPDGYTVNENGAWVENNVIQTKTVNAAEANAIDPANYVGTYSYTGAETYIYNEQTQQYNLLVATANNSWEEWNSKIHPGDFYIVEEGFTISNAKSDRFDYAEGYSAPYTLLKNGDEWVVDVNADGVLQESEKSEKSGMNLLADGKVTWSFEMQLNATEPDDLEHYKYYGWPAKGTAKVVVYFTRK